MLAPKIMTDYIEKNAVVLDKYSKKLGNMYRKCFVHTFDAMSKNENDERGYYIATGDIPAMWLRDSSTQVWNYVRFANDCEEIADLIKGLIKRQFFYISLDSYANSFNETANDRGYIDDVPRKSPWVWERKYEIDSLAYPIRLIYAYWKTTGDDKFVAENLPQVMKIIVKQWQVEQHHAEMSPYRFTRVTEHYNETIHNNGLGSPVQYTGMTWQGFRPSDDAGTYGYSIPSNLFAYVVLGYACEMLETIDKTLVDDMNKLRNEIHNGVKKFGIVNNEKYGKIFAYETDGSGHYEFMDDANIPSLISLPYIGYNDPETKEVYENTRKFILSKDNPYYYEGSVAKGIGSPHEYTGYIWHLGLSIQGLTSSDKTEMKEVLDMLIFTDADTGYMHECFDKDDPFKFRREFFTWSDSMFCEFAEKCIKDGLFD